MDRTAVNAELDALEKKVKPHLTLFYKLGKAGTAQQAKWSAHKYEAYYETARRICYFMSTVAASRHRGVVSPHAVRYVEDIIAITTRLAQVHRISKY
jgi:hypothetical protein